MKTESTKKSAVETSISGNQLTLAFANGCILFVQTDELSEAIQHAAMMHGLKQKLCDAAAISRDPETGRTATIETKYVAVKEVYDRITSAEGTWNKARESGGSAGGLLLSALIRMYAGRKTREQLTEYLAGKTQTEHAALRKTAKIAAIIEEIKLERAKTGDDDGIDTEELLSELEN